MSKCPRKNKWNMTEFGGQKKTTHEQKFKHCWIRTTTPKKNNFTFIFISMRWVEHLSLWPVCRILHEALLISTLSSPSSSNTSGNCTGAGEQSTAINTPNSQLFGISHRPVAKECIYFARFTMVDANLLLGKVQDNH